MMLRAYDYIEPGNSDFSVQNKMMLDREMSLARKFVDNTALVETVQECPLCGSQDIRFFYEKWKKRYFRCGSCFSMFLPADRNQMEAYKAYEELNAFRLSDEYQAEAFNRREYIWEDSIDWIRYRAFRYLHRNEGLDIIDYGNKYARFIDMLCHSTICGNYELRDSIISGTNPGGGHIRQADIVLHLNILNQSVDPVKDLASIGESLKKSGLLFLSTRIGTGFDILTLKENIGNIYPYEHILLPSREGLEIALKKAGYTLLELLTPGLLDVNYVMGNKEKIEGTNYFMQYLFHSCDKTILAEFQRFLQRSGMSSYAQLVAKKDVCS